MPTPVTIGFTGSKKIYDLFSKVIGFNSSSFSDNWGVSPSQLNEIYENPETFIIVWQRGYFEHYKNIVPEGFSIGDIFLSYFGYDSWYSLWYYYSDKFNNIELNHFSNMMPEEKVSPDNINSTNNSVIVSSLFNNPLSGILIVAGLALSLFFYKG